MATLFDRVTPRARWSFQVASIFAAYAGQTMIGPEHLLAGVVFSQDSAAMQVLRQAGIDRRALWRAAVRDVLPDTGPAGQPGDRLSLAPASRAALVAAVVAAEQMGHPAIGTGHVLVGVAQTATGQVAALLARFGITADALRPQVQALALPPAEQRAPSRLPNPLGAPGGAVCV